MSLIVVFACGNRCGRVVATSAVDCQRALDEYVRTFKRPMNFETDAPICHPCWVELRESRPDLDALYRR